MVDLASAYLGGVEAKRRGLVTQDALEDSRRRRAEEDVLLGMKKNVAESFRNMTTDEVEEQDPNTGLMVKRPKTPAEREAARIRHETDLVTYAIKQDPVKGAELQKAFEDRSAHKGTAIMFGVMQSLLSGNSESGFKTLDKLYQSKGEERVDLEKSYYDRKSGEGVLVTVDKKDPSKFSSVPLNPEKIKGMFVGSANTPSALLFLSAASKAMDEMNKAEISGQEAAAGIGTNRALKISADTTQTEAQTGLTEIETQLKQGLLNAGFPQAQVDEVISKTGYYKASAARQRALASNEGVGGDNKSALAVLYRQRAFDTFLGTEKPGEMRKQYLTELREARNNLASKEEIAAIEDDFKERFEQNKLKMAIKGTAETVLSSNKGLNHTEALAVASELEGARKQAIEVMRDTLEKSSGKKATREDIDAAVKSVLGDKLVEKDGKRFYKLGNRLIKY